MLESFGFGSLLCYFLRVGIVVILIRVVLSWFPFDPRGVMATVTGFFYTITDFMILPLRRILPMPRVGGFRFDFSPLLIILIFQILMVSLC